MQKNKVISCGYCVPVYTFLLIVVIAVWLLRLFNPADTGMFVGGCMPFRIGARYNRMDASCMDGLADGNVVFAYAVA